MSIETKTVTHPTLGQCQIIKRSPTSTYIRMPSGRCFIIAKNEPERSKALQFVLEVEKEPFVSEILPKSPYIRPPKD